MAAALAAGEGTAWLWARTEMAGAGDVLVIVEAGEMSRAKLDQPIQRGPPARRRRLRPSVTSSANASRRLIRELLDAGAAWVGHPAG